MNAVAAIVSAVLLEIFLMIAVTCVQTFFCSKTIGLSQKWRGRRLALVIVLFGVIEAALELAAINLANLFGAVSVYVFFAVIILYPAVVMAGEMKIRIFFGVVNCAVFLFTSLLTTVILIPLIATARNSWLTAFLMSGIVLVVYTVLILGITHFSTEGKRYLPPKFWTGFTVCFCIIIVGGLVVVRIMGLFTEVKPLQLFLAIATLAFFAVSLLIYIAFYFSCKYFTKSAEAGALAIQNDLTEKYLLRKQASDERIQILSHDLKHSLAQWRALAEEKSDAGALQTISEYEEELRASILIQSGNETANAILNQKRWEAGQKGLEFSVDGVFHEDLLVSKLDLCSLLGNLIDNAIEAAAEADEDHGYVNLSIRRKGNLLIVAVENGYGAEPVLQNGAFLTTKRDDGLHAIGTRSIEYAAEKYNGAVDHSYKDHVFKTTVMLCGYSSGFSDKK